MATPPELREVEESHRAAQAALGLAGAYLVMRDWTSVPAPNVSATATGWISPALRVINAIRKKSRRLAQRYYRLARAIETGSTLGLPDSVESGSSVTMGVLREEYFAVMREIANLGTDDGATSEDPDERFFEEELAKTDPEADVEDNRRAELLTAVDLPTYIEEWLEAEEIPDGTFIDVDEYDWSETDEDFEEIRDLLEDAIHRDVIELGDRKIQEIRDSDLDAGTALDRVQEQHDASGSAAAGRVDRYGILAGRDEINTVIQRDSKVKLVARGLGPNPCAFCAMLASRGFVYKSKRTAQAAGEDSIRRYHDNCHCYPIVRWVDASDLPEANAWLQDKWYEVTAGTSGPEMRRTWRRWFDRQGREELRQFLDGQVSQANAA